MFSISDGRLHPSRWCGSPNYDQRSQGDEVNLLVIHCISLPPQEFGGCDREGISYIDRLFTNSLDPSEHEYFAQIAHLKVSAHLLVNRQGVITQYVNFDNKAWHAGKSSFLGKPNCNDFSIGIELEGWDNGSYTDLQYQALAGIGPALRSVYPGISDDRIVGHEHIAPERKTDPGPGFDWGKLRALL